MMLMKIGILLSHWLRLPVMDPFRQRFCTPRHAQHLAKASRMPRVRRNHFLRRIDHNSPVCIIDQRYDIVNNAHIIEQYAPIVARRRGPHEPLTLATLTALHNSQWVLAVDKAEPRRHHTVFWRWWWFLGSSSSCFDRSRTLARMPNHSGQAQFPKFVSQNQLEKGIKEKRRNCHRHCRCSLADCHINHPLSPPAQHHCCLRSTLDPSL